MKNSGFDPMSTQKKHNRGLNKNTFDERAGGLDVLQE
jgi:hypothetical protein